MSLFDLGNKNEANKSEQSEKSEENLPPGESERRNKLEQENKIEEQKEKEKEIDDRDKRPENKEKKFQFLIPEEKYNKMKSSIKNAIKGFMNKLDQKKEDILNKKTMSFEKKAKEASNETDGHNQVTEDGKVEKPWWKLWGGKRRRTRRKKKGKKKKTNKKKTRRKTKRRTRRKRNRKTKKRNTAKRSLEQSGCISRDGEELNVGDIVSFRLTKDSGKQKPGEIVEIDNNSRNVRVKHKMYSSANNYTMRETGFIPCGSVKLATKDFEAHWYSDINLS